MKRLGARAKAAVRSGLGIIWYVLLTLAVLIYASFLWAVSHLGPTQ